jgi:hypothetical protein
MQVQLRVPDEWGQLLQALLEPRDVAPQKRQWALRNGRLFGLQLEFRGGRFPRRAGCRRSRLGLRGLGVTDRRLDTSHHQEEDEADGLRP